jgi:hypothetical protein
MPQSKVTGQLLHMRRLEYITHQTLTFTLKKLTSVARHDTRRILATMLKHRQRIINISSNAFVRGNSNHTTHFSCS